MRTAAEIKPRDVSKGLFMDLAFLLIATLVLLVQEPSKQKKSDVSFSELRRTPVNKVEERNLPGESIFLEVLSTGEVMEVLYNNQRRTLSLDQISHRIDQMPQEGERVVALFIDQGTPYSKVTPALDEVSRIQQAGKVNKVYEIVRKD